MSNQSIVLRKELFTENGWNKLLGQLEVNLDASNAVESFEVDFKEIEMKGDFHIIDGILEDEPKGGKGQKSGWKKSKGGGWFK
ncbi:hypothetical protein [Photobacterium sp.]|uniref:hypothetical protein n=1 Tax=Photobacterium sp. TaxID=660 RepID=UPI00299E6223|nr:hypothetical protein [Photobacterium sp.]MDX1300911.1 hypothetical protein [Photobacterium sp.]